MPDQHCCKCDSTEICSTGIILICCYTIHPYGLACPYSAQHTQCGYTHTSYNAMLAYMSHMQTNAISSTVNQHNSHVYSTYITSVTVRTNVMPFGTYTANVTINRKCDQRNQSGCVKTVQLHLL